MTCLQMAPKYILLLISCCSAEPRPRHLLPFYLKMNPPPENELLIAVPVGRACPHNVRKQIYVPTVTGTPTADTYLLAAEKKQLN